MGACVSATILYLDTIPGDQIHALTLAGIRRYAAALGWKAAAVPDSESRPEALKALLRVHAPVAGCVVECADLHADLPPRLFGKTPVVYLHAAPALYGGAGARIRWDGEAIARTAFRELSAGRPPSFAVAGTNGSFEWSLERMKAFASLAEKAGATCFVFDPRPETEERRMERLAQWVAGLPRHTAVFATRPGPSPISPLLAVRRRSTGVSARREKFVLEAVEMIRREACDGLTPMALAKRFRCSRTLFNLRFREATGHSVLDEIRHVRLEKALALLAGTDTPIGAVADFCGFGSGVELVEACRETAAQMYERRAAGRRLPEGRAGDGPAVPADPRP